MNKEVAAEPVLQVDRSPVLMGVMTVVSAAIVWQAVQLLADVRPAGFIVMVPGVIFSFHSLWFMLSPFASVYPDSFEVRMSLFHYHRWYFRDIKSIVEKNKEVFIVFHDGEVEPLRLFGIRQTQTGNFIAQLKKEVAAAMPV